MSDRFSAASEASTSGSSEPGCESSSKPNPTPGADASSTGTGPTSPAMRTYETSVLAFMTTESFDSGMSEEVSPALRVGSGLGIASPPAILTSSAAASPAKTSASPAAAPDSPAPDPACSSSSPESQMSLFAQADGSSLRTSPACSIPKVDEISQSFYGRWATSGFTTSPGECWTADTSECPNGGDASSSLQDVLLAEVPKRFFLSPRAAAGILRRAEKRGRELPPALAEALTALASAHPDDARKTMRTSSPGSASPPDTANGSTTTPTTSLSPTPLTEWQEEPTTTAPKQTISSPPQTISSPPLSSADPAEGGPRPSAPATTPTATSSPTPSEPKASTPARTEPDEEPPSFLSENQRAEVLETPYARQLTTGGGKPGQGYPAARIGSTVRRLTPTECERLQGFPDGHTIPSPTAPATPRWGTPSPSTCSNGSGAGSSPMRKDG